MFLKTVCNPIALAALIVTGCNFGPSTTETFSGTVTKVHDGDSIHITPKGRKRVVIRLAGIDAPELTQPFGIKSRDKLRSLILNRKAEASCHKTDRYQRQVCTVIYSGVDINLQMVASGMAWHYKQYQKEQSGEQRNAFARAERNARKNLLGLWRGESLEPWIFRKVN